MFFSLEFRQVPQKAASQVIAVFRQLYTTNPMASEMYKHRNLFRCKTPPNLEGAELYKLDVSKCHPTPCPLDSPCPTADYQPNITTLSPLQTTSSSLNQLLTSTFTKLHKAEISQPGKGISKTINGMFTAASALSQVTDMKVALDMTERGQALDMTEVKQALVMTELTQALGMTEMKQALDMAEVKQALDMTDMTQTLDMTEITQALDMTEMTEALHMTEGTEALDMTIVTQALETMTEITQALKSIPKSVAMPIAWIITITVIIVMIVVVGGVVFAVWWVKGGVKQHGQNVPIGTVNNMAAGQIVNNIPCEKTDLGQNVGK
uniref:Uncharacterized protein n=1 Tax=Branchiostoma floridae TaxID=7739 RepID=C3Y964_BRAFL|eukprot:XP_002607110.1 hypothetical protein BRAFLDRAFT_68096 [Branchiostoma floridae]